VKELVEIYAKFPFASVESHRVQLRGDFGLSDLVVVFDVAAELVQNLGSYILPSGAVDCCNDGALCPCIEAPIPIFKSLGTRRHVLNQDDHVFSSLFACAELSECVFPNGRYGHNFLIS